MSNIRVKKRNGRLEDFEVNKINAFVERCCENLSAVSASEDVLDMQTTCYDKIPTYEIDKAIELTARQKIYKEPNYSYVAARVVLSNLYKEVLRESVDADTFEADYRSSFVKNVKKCIRQKTKYLSVTIANHIKVCSKVLKVSVVRGHMQNL